MNRTFAQTLLGIVLVLLLSGAPSLAFAADILFDFESAPNADDGNGVNPVFIKDGFTLTHTEGAGFGVAQWTNNFGVPAFSGIGTLRLSAAAPAPHFFLTARVDFSEPVSAVSLHALDFFGTSNFTISALSASDTVLGTFTVTSVFTYEFVEFSGIGTIAALLFSGNNANQASWDDLTVSRIEEEVWAVDSSQDALYTVNLATGATTVIGPLHPDSGRFMTPVSMAVRPVDGVIFVNNNSPASDDGLAIVDPATGLATLVNPTGGPGGDYIGGAMAFDDLGNLYAADSTGALAIVDQSTGAATPLGGLPLPTLFGLDFNPADNMLYGITGSPSALDLLKIDPVTGALLSTTPLTTALGGSAAGTLLFDSAGTLHGTTNAATLNLFEIDPSNGNVSNIRTVTAGFSPQGMGLVIDTIEVTVPVPDGDDVVIDAGFITAIAEKVVQAGTIDFEFCVAILDSSVGESSVSLSEFSNTGTCGVLPDLVLPSGFEPIIAADGRPKLGVVNADSTVLFEGLITEFQDMERVLGFDPGCSTDRPRSLGASEKDVKKNNVLKLKTGECNRARSLRSDYSTIVFPLTFTGHGRSLAISQVQIIEKEFLEASCITQSVLSQLERTAKQIKRKINGKEFVAAQNEFIEFALIAQNNPDAFASCPVERNFRGLFTADGIIGAFIVSEEILGETFVIPSEINLPGEGEG